MSITAQPDAVERVRRCLAEAGYPNARVKRAGEGVAIVVTVPPEPSWRALCIAGAPERDGGPQPCLACFKAAPILKHCELSNPPPMPWDCLARGEGLTDCHVDRNTP